MFKKILNLHEEVTDQRLVSVCAGYGARVCPKVRIADVLLIEQSGVSDMEYSYALSSTLAISGGGSQLIHNHLPVVAANYDLVVLDH
jgi:hypothetical protein